MLGDLVQQRIDGCAVPDSSCTCGQQFVNRFVDQDPRIARRRAERTGSGGALRAVLMVGLEGLHRRSGGAYSPPPDALTICDRRIRLLD